VQRYSCRGMRAEVSVQRYLCRGICAGVSVQRYLCRGMRAEIAVQGYLCRGICAEVFVQRYPCRDSSAGVFVQGYPCRGICAEVSVRYEQLVNLGIRTVLISRVGQNRIYTPYMTVYLVISLPSVPYMHRIYMVLANPTHKVFDMHSSWLI
jgi:hypothetical protein